MAPGIPFDRDFKCQYGIVEPCSALIRRVVAPNPGPFTFTGTGSYIVGHGTVAIIDPGPAIEAHVEALLAAVRGERVSHILVTHSHADHSPASRPLSRATGAPILGFGPHGGDGGDELVEEGADRAFMPDRRLADGERVTGGDSVGGGDFTLEAVHTPGHTANHLCYALVEEKALFTGDHVMAWSTSVISPPDGNMAQYMASLDKLLTRDDAVYWPTHGPPIRDPKPFVTAFIAHRRVREAQIRACLEDGIDGIPEMVAAMYREVPAMLHGAAGHSVLAHLVYMIEQGAVVCDSPPAIDGRFRLADRR